MSSFLTRSRARGAARRGANPPELSAAPPIFFSEILCPTAASAGGRRPLAASLAIGHIGEAPPPRRLRARLRKKGPPNLQAADESDRETRGLGQKIGSSQIDCEPAMNWSTSQIRRRQGLKLGVAGLTIASLQTSTIEAKVRKEVMAIRKVELERFSLMSSKQFEAVVAALGAAIGQPDMVEFSKRMKSAASFAELEQIIQRGLGRTELMLFAQFDLGAILRRETGLDTPKIVRFVVGNPLIMKEMVKHVPDAGSYAPVTILVDERADGVHMSYDKVACLLASYGDSRSVAVARDLDAKIETLLKECAS